MSIFNNMFGNNNQSPKMPANPQETVMAILGQMKNQGKITEAQYNSLLQNQKIKMGVMGVAYCFPLS